MLAVSPIVRFWSLTPISTLGGVVSLVSTESVIDRAVLEFPAVSVNFSASTVRIPSTLLLTVGVKVAV